ncbi:MAG: hypothetical protein NVSMB13_01530 [Mycobacteriales bacterium]
MLVGTGRATGRIRLLAGILALVAAGASAVAPGSARAETSVDAQREADQILGQVNALEDQVARATKDYDAALDGLAASVSASISADQAYGDAEQVAAGSQQRLDERVRGLYISGGSLTLYVSLLNARSVSDLADRQSAVRRVIDSDRSSVTAYVGALVPMQDNKAALGHAVAAQVANSRRVTDVANRLDGLLAQQQGLLDSATERVRTLKGLEEAAARLAAQKAAEAAITAARIAELHPLAPPADYFALYHAAAPTCPGLSWTILAAIGQVETGHGRDLSTSSAGAVGPMQFLPATFAAVAVDGNHDGRKDIRDPADAIFSAARYLCENGAGGDARSLYNAIWNYNHADWYVQMVLKLASQFQ